MEVTWNFQNKKFFKTFRRKPVKKQHKLACQRQTQALLCLRNFLFYEKTTVYAEICIVEK